MKILTFWTKEERIETAIQFLKAKEVLENNWEYYDEGTQKWYVCDDMDDLVLLGTYLTTGVSEAYSIWCSETDHEEAK